VIRGHVQTATGQPLSRARVTLTGPPGWKQLVTTNADGDYEIADVPAGHYRLTADRTGYLTGEYGVAPDSLADAALRLVVSRGVTIEHADVTLLFGAVIDGHVVDETGQPLPRARVEAVAAASSRGTRLFIPVSAVMADDVGHFRITGLRPDTYAVRASFAGPAAAADTAYATTYFPGVIEPVRASTIAVTAGSRAEAVDVALVPVPTAAISGRVLHSNGQPAPGVDVVMTGSDPRPGPQPFRPVTATAGFDGSFTFRDLQPGWYLLTSDVSAEEDARHFVTVSGSNVNGVQLFGRGVVWITASVVIETGGAPPFAAAPIRGVLLPVDAGAAATPDAEAILPIGEDWRFITRVRGPVLLRLAGLPDGWDVVRVEAEGADVTDRPFPEFSTHEARVSIVIAPRMPSTDGRGAR
jgi:hypothetical protein